MSLIGDIKANARKRFFDGNFWTVVCGCTIYNFLVSASIGGFISLAMSFASKMGFMYDPVLGLTFPDDLTSIEGVRNTCITLGACAVGSLIPLYFVAVGVYGLMTTSLAAFRGSAKVAHSLNGFGRGWRIAWLMGLSQFYVFLWSILLVVPGIVAAYSYRLIYFIAIDHPEYSASQVIAESKRLMKGNRMKLFILDISFILWFIACNYFWLLGLYVTPYYSISQAAFYEGILDKDEENEGEDVL
jgi:uncharacterized membrane protein